MLEGEPKVGQSRRKQAAGRKFELKRYGLLATISRSSSPTSGVFYPMTTELTAWYAIDFTIALVICLALAAYGFYKSLGGEKRLSGKLLEG